MELKIESYQLPAALSFNYDELKADLLAKVAKYENLVYTDEQIAEAKTDKANLNKLKKALNDERIRQEREYMKPFMDFKTKINEIIGIIDQPVQIIDRQVQEFEDQRKQKKMTEIGAYFNQHEERPEWLNFKQIFNEKWLNASTSMKSIKLAIDEKLGQIKLEMKTLEALPEFAFEAVECYKKTLNISMAIEEGKRLAEIQKRKAEAEEQRKQREAEEKARKEAAALQPAPVETVQPVAQQQAEAPAGEWITFKAFLTAEQAAALGAFFREHGIKYGRA